MRVVSSKKEVGGDVVVDDGVAVVIVVACLACLARCVARLVCLSKLEYMSKVRCRFFLGLATVDGGGVALSLAVGQQFGVAAASGTEAGWEACSWFFTNSIGYKTNVDTTPPTPAAKASDKGFMATLTCAL